MTPRKTTRFLTATLLSLSLAGAATAQGAADAKIDRARQAVEAENPELAVKILDAVLKENPLDSRALLWRGTALAMLGEMDDARGDLAASVANDPGQRQAWLNLAAIDLSEGRNEGALTALRKARELDPSAPENDLNIGAVEILTGELAAAAESFQRYIAADPTSADRHYMVATNYAMNGYVALARSHLEQAIARDERSRLRARTDTNFAALSADGALDDILLNDSYRPPEGSLVVRREFDARYAGGNGEFLSAMLDALRFHSEPFEASVEVTPDWALIWATFRIKLSNGPQGKGRIELSAPAGSMPRADWQKRTSRILRSFERRLIGLPLLPGVG